MGVLNGGRDIVSHLRVAVGWCGSGGGWRVEWSGGVVEWWSGGVYSIFLKNIGDFSRICHKGVSICAGPFFLAGHVFVLAD